MSSCHISLCPRISIHVQETDTPGELLVTRGGSLRTSPPAETPAAVPPGEQDPPGPRCCPQAPGTESGKPIPRGASVRKRSCDGGAKAKEKQGPGSELTMAPSRARRDKAADSGAPGPQQDTSPGAGNPDPGKDCTAGGAGSAEAGRRTPPGAEAGSLVLGK